MFNRIEAVAKIRDFVKSINEVTAAWEGGSIATGFSDDISDLDLYLVSEDDDKEKVLEKMKNFFESEFGIEKYFRLPEPTWHGFSQVFLKPNKTEELFYVDFLVINESSKNKMMEENRHGVGEVWVENSLIDTNDTSLDEIENLCRSIYKRTITTDFILIIEVKKAIIRGIFSETQPQYLSFISRYLIPLLNIKYRPCKADFGMRYIYRDYDNDNYKMIENYLKVTSVEEISNNFNKIITTYESLKDELAYLL